tara:strand:- start:977 stop:2356 length:1380 start_codon:yes stop_codon:yes gene_type:complete
MRDIATFIALNRFGLGASPGEAERVYGDPRGWILSQINPSQALPTSLSAFSASSDILAEIHAARMESPERVREVIRRLYRDDFRRETFARAVHMIKSELPFAERMVLFWSNHFTVSRTKWIIGPAIPAYEREAIRPHIFGNFADMLKAVCRHPTMITYLDNHMSMGANSRAGRYRRRRRGNKTTLNENLAREVMELHTLGVNGGYTQQDVTELAKVMSGWSHGGVRFRKRQAGPAREPVHGGFEYRAAFHEPGSKTIMGDTYHEDGENEGFRVLDNLVRHPATANFIGTKLVRHFVADNPPLGAVDKIAGVFKETEGDLAAVSRALVNLPEVWLEPLPKVKSAYELVISTHRAAGRVRPNWKSLIQPLQELGQLPFSAPSPQGWGDEAKDWIAPEALMRRIEWLRRFAGRVPSTMVPSEVMDSTIGPVSSEATQYWVSRATSGDAALATVFVSPEFQRR